MNSTMSLKNQNESQATLYRSQAQIDDSIKTAEVHAVNLKKVIDLCEEKIRRYAETVKQLQSEITDAKDSVKSSQAYARKEVEPIIDKLFKEMEEQRTLQMQQYGKLQNQIIELKKEKAELVQNIIKYKQKVDELQKDLGRYPGDPGVKSRLGYTRGSRDGY